MNLDKNTLFPQGVYCEEMTSPARLNTLIEKLFPVKTGIDLVRVGGANDGGYLLPNDFQGIDTCFSPGVDVNSSFETELLTKYQIESHLADYSVEGPPNGFTPKSFTKKFIGAMNDDTYTTLDTWVRKQEEFDSEHDFILQMDIEGGEYESIISTPIETIKRFRIIALELHQIESWGHPLFFKFVETFFSKLLQHFYVVHNHPNNCCGLVNLGGVIAPRVFELTLLRKDRATPDGFVMDFPHPLDAGNETYRPDLILPQNWHSQNASSMTDFFADHHPNRFLEAITGLVHIGASVGQERQQYEEHGLDVIWVEPIPEVFERLVNNIVPYPKQHAYQYLLTDEHDKTYQFHISSNAGESSSIFELARHKEIWPEVHYTNSIELNSTTFARLVAKESIDLGKYQALVMDTQGSELLILQGAGELLNQFHIIKVEAADFEAYAGCCRVEDLSSYLKDFGFIELWRNQFAQSASGGSYFDLIYIRQ